MKCNVEARDFTEMTLFSIVALPRALNPQKAMREEEKSRTQIVRVNGV